MFHRNKDILLQNHGAISKLITCPFDAIPSPNPQTILEVCHRSPKYTPSRVVFHSRIRCGETHALRAFRSRLLSLLQSGAFPQPLFSPTSLLSKITGQLFYRVFLDSGLTEVSSFLDLDHTFFNRNVAQQCSVPY